jgi:hypothetical protein
MKWRALIASGLGLPLWAQCADAQQNNSSQANIPMDRIVNVATSGKESAVSVSVLWDGNCAALPPPRLTLKLAPSHGSVCARSSIITPPRNYAPNGSKECVGKRIAGLRLFYNAQPGYVGSDTFDYLVEFPWGQRLTHVEVDVRPGAAKTTAARPEQELFKSDKEGSVIPVCVALTS